MNWFAIFERITLWVVCIVICLVLTVDFGELIVHLFGA
jgi:hypothetical protein